MMVKIFWRQGCPKCPAAKELGKKLSNSNVNVKIYNLENIDGLSEGTLFGVMSTPTTIVVDDENKEVASWRGETPSEAEIKKHII